jgi:hypothetical protein
VVVVIDGVVAAAWPGIDRDLGHDQRRACPIRQGSTAGTRTAALCRRQPFIGETLYRSPLSVTLSPFGVVVQLIQFEMQYYKDTHSQVMTLQSAVAEIQVRVTSRDACALLAVTVG